MKRSLALMGIGAGLMYLLDPELGPVRRSMLRDRFQELLPQTNDALAHKASEVAERAGEITERADTLAADTIQSLAADKLHSDGNSSGHNSNDEPNPEPAS